MNNLILIPARSGSTRVKNKNIKVLGDKPLIGHIISSALDSGVSRVVVSTNSKQTAEVARSFGAEVPFLRPESLSGTNASSLWVILHALQWLKENENWMPEIIAFCPPTNPFIKGTTISAMAEMLLSKPAANSIISITKPKTHPFRIIELDNKTGKINVGSIKIQDKTIMDIERSQDWPEVYEGSPASRMTRTKYFYQILQNTKNIQGCSGKTYDPSSCIGHKISQFESFDIDDENDWLMAEMHIKLNKTQL